MRLKSVSNISKITKSMKMIASTKMIKAQKLMEVARVYGQGSKSFFENVGVPATDKATTFAIAVSSDRGLCGGIHSSISKAVKRFAHANPSTAIAVVGLKAKPQIAREAKSKIVISFDQAGKVAPTWDEVAIIAQAILDTKTPHETISIFYNKFKSVIAYESSIIHAYPLATLQKSTKLSAYEAEEGVLDHFAQFAFANTLYAAYVEGTASEMASKRTAMENATKNAGEMIQKMTLTYNRQRQAVITNELCDIITGASAL